jgi:hypothetical protein
MPVYRKLEGSGNPRLSLLGRGPESVLIDSWEGREGCIEIHGGLAAATGKTSV